MKQKRTLNPDRKRKASKHMTALNIVMPQELKAHLEAAAREDDRTVSNYCRIILAKYLAELDNHVDKPAAYNAE